jgi:hypothetical protein
LLLEPRKFSVIVETDTYEALTFVAKREGLTVAAAVRRAILDDLRRRAANEVPSAEPPRGCRQPSPTGWRWTSWRRLLSTSHGAENWALSGVRRASPMPRPDARRAGIASGTGGSRSRRELADGHDGGCPQCGEIDARHLVTCAAAAMAPHAPDQAAR